MLTSCCRNTDVCARLGGDEFAIILPHTDAAAAGIVRDRIRRCMAQSPLDTGDAIVRLGVSVGFGTLPGDADYPDALMAAADSDMYKAKEASRVYA